MICHPERYAESMIFAETVINLFMTYYPERYAERMILAETVTKLYGISRLRGIPKT